MLLPSKDGIKCDFCKKALRSKFTYYSYDCHKVMVDVSRVETSKEKITDVNGSILGFDVCEECHNKIIKTMLEDPNGKSI